MLSDTHTHTHTHTHTQICRTEELVMHHMNIGCSYTPVIEGDTGDVASGPPLHIPLIPELYGTHIPEFAWQAIHAARADLQQESSDNVTQSQATLIPKSSACILSDPIDPESHITPCHISRPQTIRFILYIQIT